MGVEQALTIPSEVSFLRSNFSLTEPHFNASETKNQTLVSGSLLTSLFTFMARPITIHRKHPAAPDSELIGCARLGEGAAARVDSSAQFVWLSLWFASMEFAYWSPFISVELVLWNSRSFCFGWLTWVHIKRGASSETLGVGGCTYFNLLLVLDCFQKCTERVDLTHSFHPVHHPPTPTKSKSQCYRTHFIHEHASITDTILIHRVSFPHSVSIWVFVFVWGGLVRALSIPALWRALPDPGLPLFQWSGEWPGSTHEQQCQQPCQLGEYRSASLHQLQGLWWRLSLLTTRASAKYRSKTKQRKGLKNNTCKACVSSVWTPSAWRALCKDHTCKGNQSSEWKKA